MVPRSGVRGMEGEQNDLASQMPERVAEMLGLVELEGFERVISGPPQ